MFDLETKIKAGARIIDVRTAEEFNEEHYPNALNIPVDQIRQRLTEVDFSKAEQACPQGLAIAALMRQAKEMLG